MEIYNQKRFLENNLKREDQMILLEDLKKELGNKKDSYLCTLSIGTPATILLTTIAIIGGTGSGILFPFAGYFGITTMGLLYWDHKKIKKYETKISELEKKLK